MSKKRLVPPSFRSRSGRFYEWAALIREAKQRPNLWWLAMPAVPLATVRAVRERRHVDLHREDGVLEAQARNQYLDEGHAMADLYVRWIPKEES